MRNILLIVTFLSTIISYGQCDKISEIESEFFGFTNRHILKDLDFMTDKKIVIYYEKNGYWQEVYSDMMTPFDGYKKTMPDSDLKFDIIFYAQKGCRYAFGNGTTEPVEFKVKEDETKWKVK